ncbi:DUF2752 domain-containing protein [Winogradskyella eckloniae]|uniref:DUF2752 domain-containing protein n=1 Tax=Winogradskyella eckloniae TaxID=1089306 RepID=UPI00293B8ADB|nr:DUF2752 domain-containing protein [Winogradskyella eckloniae]
MLPCLNKKIFGYECMGCGLQRSIALIFKGEFVDAFFMYPAIYTLIGFFVFLIINSFKNFKNSNKIIFILAISNVIIIVVNYLIKIYLKQI